MLRDLFSSNDEEYSANMTEEELFSILNAERRRRVIAIISETDEPLTKSELAEMIAEEEFGKGYTGSDRKKVYVALHQTHLDPLVNVGAIRYVARNTYDSSGDTDAIASVIECGKEVSSSE